MVVVCRGHTVLNRVCRTAAEPRAMPVPAQRQLVSAVGELQRLAVSRKGVDCRVQVPGPGRRPTDRQRLDDTQCDAVVLIRG